MDFQSFFAAKVKDRGISLKKLAELTGISPAHLEALARGRFNDLPSAPYFRGYVLRLGKALDFDGELWWEKIRREGQGALNSGARDALPHNRFVKQSQAKFLWAGIVGALIIIYLAFQLPIIFGKPKITVTFPSQNPYTTSANTLTIQGTARDASSLSLNGDGITVASDGSWQKTVLLQSGPNTFTITAEKLLGGTVSVTEQVFSSAPPGGTAASSTASFASSTASSTSSTHPAVHFYKPSEVPATGTFYQ